MDTGRPGRDGGLVISWHWETRAVRVVFGAGRAGTLAADVAALGASRILLVAGPRAAASTAELLAELPVVASFAEVREHVPVEAAQAARALAVHCAADAILAIGGGASIGTAKAVALTSGLPIVAVPTTYAGSEVTPVWGLTEAGHKRTGRDDRVLPRIVVYDPDLTLSLPAPVSATSGLNALAHAVEAYWAPAASPVAALLADGAIRALAGALPAVVEDGTDLDARTDALFGSYLAGSAFAGAGSGLHHRICHLLGGDFGLPHAATHAVVLPYVVALNAPVVPEIAARIQAALGTPAPAHRSIAELAARVGAPRSLTELGFDPSAIPAAVQRIEVPEGNPRAVSPDDLAALLASAAAGDLTTVEQRW